MIDAEYTDRNGFTRALRGTRALDTHHALRPVAGQVTMITVTLGDLAFLRRQGIATADGIWTGQAARNIAGLLGE